MYVVRTSLLLEDATHGALGVVRLINDSTLPYWLARGWVPWDPAQEAGGGDVSQDELTTALEVTDGGTP